jgi:hypothetical protein
MDRRRIGRELRLGEGLGRLEGTGGAAAMGTERELGQRDRDNR